jgi:hypothetical protein
VKVVSVFVRFRAASQHCSFVSFPPPEHIISSTTCRTQSWSRAEILSAELQNEIVIGCFSLTFILSADMVADFGLYSLAYHLYGG